MRLPGLFPLAPAIRWALMAFAPFGIACSTPDAPASAADAFRGHAIRIVVGTSAGGGYDVVARVLAAHLGRHLPGAPAVVVDNMPGAGGLIAANFIARQAPRDGLTLGFIGENAALAQLTRDAGVQFDLRQFGTIGAPAANEADVCVMSRASGVDLDAWREARVAPRMAVTSLRSGPYARLILLSTALNLPVRPIVGYQGTAQIRLAMDGGEVEGMCSVLGSYNSAFEPKTNYRAVLQDGETAGRLLDGVPVASRLVQDARGRELLDYASRIRALPRYFVVPPETPPDRLALLRAAFDETMRDAGYLAAARSARLDIAPLSAADIDARLDAVLDLPARARERIVELLSAPKAS